MYLFTSTTRFPSFFYILKCAISIFIKRKNLSFFITTTRLFISPVCKPWKSIKIMYIKIFVFSYVVASSSFSFFYSVLCPVRFVCLLLMDYRKMLNIATLFNIYFPFLIPFINNIRILMRDLCKEIYKESACGCGCVQHHTQFSCFQGAKYLQNTLNNFHQLFKYC